MDHFYALEYQACGKIANPDIDRNRPPLQKLLKFIKHPTPPEGLTPAVHKTEPPERHSEKRRLRPLRAA